MTENNFFENIDEKKEKEFDKYMESMMVNGGISDAALERMYEDEINDYYEEDEEPDIFQDPFEDSIRAYRAMQLIDGKLYPPMATIVDKSLVDSQEIGEIYTSEEHPELAIERKDKDGNSVYYFLLEKGTLDDAGNKQTDIYARYNPYFHCFLSPLNDQFETAYKRSNLVTVEVEIPKTELTSNYKAEKAKDSVGITELKSGPVSSKLKKLGKPRQVILSRYCKINRIVPENEIADTIAELMKDTNIAIPDNTVTPSLLKELKKRNVNIEETETVKDFNKLLEEKKKNEHLLNSYKNLFKQIIEKKNTKQNKISQLNNIEVKTSTKKRGR